MKFIFKLLLVASILSSCSDENKIPKKEEYARSHWNTVITYSFVKTSYFERNIETPSLISSFGHKMRGITPDEAKELTRKAANEWSSTANIVLKEVEDSANVQIRIGSLDLKSNIAGFGYFPGDRTIDGDIHIDNTDRRWDSFLFYRIILHEMGHALGLTHHSDKTSLMHPKPTAFSTINETDLKTIRTLYGFPPSIIQ